MLCFADFPQFGPRMAQRAEHVTCWPSAGRAARSLLHSNRRQVGWYLNGLCLFFFWSRVCMWAQYKGPCPFEGDSTRKARRKETLLWCFIYQRNDFPQIKTCSILPVRLEQAARFLSWKLCVLRTMRPARMKEMSRLEDFCGELLFDRKFRLNHMFTVFVTFGWSHTIVLFELIEMLKQKISITLLKPSSRTKGKDESISFEAVKSLRKQ